jgi:hypothetical protein
MHTPPFPFYFAIMVCKMAREFDSAGKLTIMKAYSITAKEWRKPFDYSFKKA